jgi:hypothetical protein
VYVYDACTNLK